MQKAENAPLTVDVDPYKSTLMLKAQLLTKKNQHGS